MHDLWNFQIRDDVEDADLRFDTLKYAATAATSYQVFRRLRQRGEIPARLRFQVSLPTAESIAFFFRDPDQFRRVIPPYTEAMKREVDALLAAIPPEDLAIQWDVCTEVLDAADGVFDWTDWGGPRPLERYPRQIARLSRRIPAQVPVGYHLCYADLGHQHLLDPKDLGLVVEMANLAAAHAGRRVDYFHLPVPSNRDDDDDFAPLRSLNIGDAQVYLGLVHHHDGVPGARKRIRTAGRHLERFGIATECGFGRRPPSQVPDLVRIHRDLLSGSTTDTDVLVRRPPANDVAAGQEPYSLKLGWMPSSSGQGACRGTRAAEMRYFPSDPHNDDDIASAVKPELLLAPHPASDGDGLEVTYDFVLDPAPAA